MRRARLGCGALVPCGSAGIKAVRVATGEADLYVHPARAGMRWDTCAPEAILAAAGGRMTDLQGNPFVYNRTDLYNRHGILATNGAAHDRILERVAEVFAV